MCWLFLWQSIILLILFNDIDYILILEIGASSNSQTELLGELFKNTKTGPVPRDLDSWSLGGAQ